jgi:Flp pilus assembly protein TadB
MDPYLALAVACTGFGVAAAAHLSGGTEDRSVPERERRRRDDLRRRSFVYRHLGGLVARLGPVYRCYGSRLRDRVTADLEVLGEGEWRADEYLATRHVGLAPAAVAAGLFAGLYSGLAAGLGLGLGLLALAPILVAREVRSRAARRVRAIRARLPYTLDLMALVLEAGGGTLFDCLRLGAEENAGHPLGDEYRRVVGAIEKGVAPADALERAAEEAKVHITWPAMLVMVACLLVVVAPFLATLLPVMGW